MKVILLLVLLSLAAVASAQDQYLVRDGRLIQTVQVRKATGHEAHRYCTILDKGQRVQFTPEQVSEYKNIESNVFYRKSINGENYFLESIYNGKDYAVYRFVTEQEITLYYLESNEQLTPLPKSTYREQLEDMWPQCLDRSLVGYITYDSPSLSDALQMIETCTELYIPKPRTYVYATIAIEKPITLTTTTPDTRLPKGLYLQSDWTASHFSYGGGVLYKRPFAGNLIGINMGADLLYLSYGGSSLFLLEDGNVQELTFNTSIINLGFPVTFEVSGNIKGTVPYLELGAELSLNSLNKAEEMNIVGNFPNEPIVNTNTGVKIEDNVNVGILLGGGIEFSIGEHEFLVSTIANLRIGTSGEQVYNKQAISLNLGYKL